ncbi:hypothetical protein [Erythrobacter oryzae]|uniref:hypothetical protein n=1 Tax=Erythrobacter oryzae TaxID=3019556 RepID=UPI00255503E4|nr:hypothetical protein [Erythrobacter sp. COR-2]
MIDEPPTPPPAVAEIWAPAVPLDQLESDGRVVIDLTRLVPPPPAGECTDEAADPLTSEIVVCAASTPAPRLGPVVGPVDDGFGSAIPRARLKLSDNAEAEANLINQGVGGFNANGGEVRVKIDF